MPYEAIREITATEEACELAAGVARREAKMQINEEKEKARKKIEETEKRLEAMQREAMENANREMQAQRETRQAEIQTKCDRLSEFAGRHFDEAVAYVLKRATEG